MSGRSAIVRLDKAPPGLRFNHGAPILDFDPSSHFSAREIGQLDRFSQFAAVAARQAWSEAGLDQDAPEAERIGVIIGTANGGIDILGDGFRRIHGEGRNPLPMTVPQTMASAPASRIALEIGAKGPVFGVSSACASAAHAIVVGAGLIRGGLIDVALVGGTDSCFNEGYLRAWDQLRAVSPETCRPFSAERMGLILGEGAAVLVLEREGRAAARNSSAIARFLGGGMSSDCAGLLAPDPAGMASAMGRALIDAGLEAGSVDHINAHGTGTVANDVAEASAIQHIFGERLPTLTSIKSMLGHAMGAAGAIEAIATLATLEGGLVPPTLNFLGVDPAIGFAPVTGQALAQDVIFAVSNSFAFGGLNVSLAFGRV